MGWALQHILAGGVTGRCRSAFAFVFQISCLCYRYCASALHHVVSVLQRTRYRTL
ncbi:hypothetical protein HMPREF3190_01410 [Umbribacter vaginalis]|nr:hypothetical protein HMPREF3190_01410 [Coriobacteriales bacterium DNF00809]